MMAKTADVGGVAGDRLKSFIERISTQPTAPSLHPQRRARAYDGLTCLWEWIDGWWQITAVYDAACGEPAAVGRRRGAMQAYEGTAGVTAGSGAP